MVRDKFCYAYINIIYFDRLILPHWLWYLRWQQIDLHNVNINHRYKHRIEVMVLWNNCLLFFFFFAFFLGCFCSVSLQTDEWWRCRATSGAGSKHCTKAIARLQTAGRSSVGKRRHQTLSIRWHCTKWSTTDGAHSERSAQWKVFASSPAIG